MDTKKISFEFTDPIKRYLQEMLDYWKEQGEVMPPSKIKYADPLDIDTFLGHEEKSEQTERSFWLFIKWLQKENAIEYLDDMSPINEGLVQNDEDGEPIFWPRIFYIHVRDIRPIKELYARIHGEADEVVPKRASEDNSRLLYLEEASGEFYVGKARKKAGANMKMPYYELLVAIYLSAGMHGDTSVSEIRRTLQSRFGGKRNTTRKDVQNHINNSIKRVLRDKLPAGYKMFQWKRGTDTLFFNNPAFDQSS